MVHLSVVLSKYLMILLFLIYTFECFNIFKFQKSEDSQKRIYSLQRKVIYLIHLAGFFVLFVTTLDPRIAIIYLMQLILITMIFMVYNTLFKASSELVLNNMCMLLVIGMIILCRLSYEKAMRQFVFITVGMIISIIIPFVLSRMSMFRKLTWIYAGVGILGLLIVMIAGSTSYGAKLSISIAGISIQPSEFIKIIFVFYVASMLQKSTEWKQLGILSGVSAFFVLILVGSRDLGGALLYFFTYLVMVYVATRKLYIFAGGLGFLAIAATLGYKLFSHVQVRFIAWQDPLSVIDDAGYQICQSLFAIGTGGWFGLGLNQGKPNKIPVVEKDFVFSAISEELGGVFAFCLIMVCVSCFIMFFNISMQMKDEFYKLVALGLGSVYALQVFLTIGGVTKFIPSTGVTLPLVSYGGSSLLSTMILFGIIQGLYIKKHRDSIKETDNSDGRKRKKQKENS